MAQFPGLSLTVQGNKMILKSSTGKTDDRLIITKAVIGDGQLTASIDGLTEIVSKKLEIGLSQVKEVANGQMQLQFNFDNRNVANGFYWREVGLYAKNGDSGEEKLIGYSNAKGLTSYIPDKTNVIPMQRLVIALGVGDNPNVKGEVDFSSAITLEQLETAIDTHNKAAEVHKEQFKTINEKITAIEDSKVAKTSADYIKSLVTNTNGLEAIKGNGTKELLKLLTNVDSGDNQGLAPTLELVKNLLSGLNIKNGQDVVKALGDETLQSLGVRYDLSNPNSWYISFGKLFGGLIIQGGKQKAGEQKQSDINNLEATTNKVIFPISFTNSHLFHTFGIIASDASVFWGNSGASVISRRISRTDMRYEVHSSYQTMLKADSIIEWCIVGI
jgi:hypothetical protein